MTIPAVMFIEMAKDMLAAQKPDLLNAEAKEFHCLGEQRIAQIWDSVKDVGDGNPMLAGYLLGLETMRALIATNVKAVQAGVNL